MSLELILVQPRFQSLRPWERGLSRFRFLLPPAWGPGDACQSFSGLTPASNPPATISTAGPGRERQCDFVRVNCRGPGLMPRPLDLESSALSHFNGPLFIVILYRLLSLLFKL